GSRTTKAAGAAMDLGRPRPAPHAQATHRRGAAPLRAFSALALSLQPDWNPAWTERLAELLEPPRNARPAAAAGACVGDVVAADVVPVAHDQRFAARRAIGRASALVVHVAGVDVVEPCAQRNRARPHERGRRRGPDVGHLQSGWKAVKCSGTSGPRWLRTHLHSASISASESFLPGISSVVISVQTPVSLTRYSSVSSTGCRCPPQILK